MKLRQKMMLAPAVAIGLMVLMGVLVFLALQRQQGLMHRMASEDMARQADILQVQASMANAHARAYRIISWISSVGQAQATSDLQAVHARWDEAQQRLQHEGLLQGKEGVGTLLAQYRKSVDDAVDLASVDAATGAAAMQTADQHYQRLDKALSVALDHVSASVNDQLARNDRSATWTRIMMAVLCLLAVGVTSAVAAWGTRRVMGPVHQAVQATQAIAAGDLTVELDDRGDDEIAELLHALKAMAHSLESTVGRIQQAAETIHVASSEISTGNADLSQRTEQQAGNLQMTAGSMHQLTETVTQNTQASHQASDMAASASEVARRGGDVVEQVVSTMEGIHESSSRIGDITNVIDGIAFQTNILALNAAVEAARAGEQGRGFAVVAGEVRALAQRSAEAAKEIKALIQDSVARVDSGSQLVSDAGRTMKDVVGAVERVNHIIREISAATEEQARGLRQINQAVGQLDTMTQQNAAMVEQSAAAADSLKSQAQSLAAVINTFRVRQQRSRAELAA